jgi:ornithine cyclodeaminase/alanine dehydrogenase-like protein (mu-crystallin family)
MASVAAPVRLLTRSQIRAMLRWPELIEATAQALIAASTGQVAPTGASQLHVPGAALHLKSGALLQPPVLSVKANLRPQAGSSAGLIVAFDPVTFTIRAVLDSADITAMRTGATAAVAARQLASAGRHTVALVGAGPVSSQSLAALSEVLDIGEIRVWSRDRARAEQLAASATPPARVYGTPDEAAAGATIILTATPSRQPLLTGAELAAGALILAMGADTRGKRELAGDVLEDAELVADVPAEAVNVGELAYLPGGADRSRCAELGTLLAGQRRLPAGRRIVFDSVGTAVTDVAAVGLVLETAERENAGTLLDFTG